MTAVKTVPLVTHDRSGFSGLEGWAEDHAEEIMPRLLRERREAEDRYVFSHGVLPPGSVARDGLRVACGGQRA